MIVINAPLKYREEIAHLFEMCKSSLLPASSTEPDIDVIVATDFKSECYRLSRPADKDIFDKLGTPDLNGRVILPQRDEPFIVLFAARQFESDQYQHTVVHEFVHVFDYCHFFTEFGNSYAGSDEDRDQSYFTEFYYWSEHHAKRSGIQYFAIRKYIEAGGEVLDNGAICVSDVDFRTKHLLSQLERVLASSIASDQLNHIYWEVAEELVQYYGRAAVFQGLDSAKPVDPNFPADEIKDAFGPSAIKLYWILHSNQDYKTAVKSLPALRLLFEEMARNFAIVHLGRCQFTHINWISQAKMAQESIFDKRL